MYNKILVPLDGSRRAEAVLRHVEDLALRFGAEVVFLRIVEPASPVAAAETAYANLHRSEYERRLREAERYLSVQQGKFRALGIEADARVSTGPVVEAIVRVAERENVDLVAMARQGHSGLTQVLYNSVAAGVLHRIRRPLLVVHAQKGTESR
ncbi:MAG: universal stress protein [Anaerolineae bacterium]|nr:universal stress protein [Anaerolineae bacterium]